MIKNYIITALRNLRKNKAHSSINIAGLSVGMAVAMLIGLWIWNELSFNKYHQNYDRVAQVMINQNFNGTIATGVAIPIALDAAIRKNYGSDFKHIAMVEWTDAFIAAGAILITLLTVSVQSIKAALANPVKALKGNE